MRESDDHSKRIAKLNDEARQAMGIKCRAVQTAGISALSPEAQSAIREKVETFNTFTPDNDPYGEHDFGLVVVGTIRVFWKIDYYDLNMQYAADDPSDAQRTTRVLIVMLASEY